MKVLVVGATGAVGRPLLPQLLAAGHEVVATARHRPPELPRSVEFRTLDLLEDGLPRPRSATFGRRPSFTRPLH
jgi:uncharacterized protein YbjT (DUF2867 family)